MLLKENETTETEWESFIFGETLMKTSISPLLSSAFHKLDLSDQECYEYGDWNMDVDSVSAMQLEKEYKMISIKMTLHLDI